MKHEQVVPDYVVMLESSITILALVGCGWLLFKLVSACIWFPQYMKNLESEADKANEYLEKTLLPKDTGKEPEKPIIQTKTPPSSPGKAGVELLKEDDLSNKDDEPVIDGAEKVKAEPTVEEAKKEK